MSAYWKEEKGRKADVVVGGIIAGRWLEAKGRRKGAVVVWWGFSWNGLVEVDLALGTVVSRYDCVCRPTISNRVGLNDLEIGYHPFQNLL